MAFAVAPDKPGVPYALAVEELNAVLGGDLSAGHRRLPREAARPGVCDYSTSMKMHSPGHLGGFDGGLLLAGGHDGEALGAARVGEDLVALLDVGEAVVKQGEHVRGDLFAEAVARAEILVDPDLHSVSGPGSLSGGGTPSH